MSLSTLVIICTTLIYPLAVWLGHKEIEPRFLAGFLVLLGLTRLHMLRIGRAAYWWTGGTLLLFIAAVWSNGLVPLKLYPVLVNAVLCSIFVYSLLFPPSMIEQLARIREPDFPTPAIFYTRRVTQVWCIFFAANGTIALITALWASSAIWTLYNGLIAYLMMGLLFAGEYVVRLRFKSRLNA